ncbi:hypothetical protein NAPIS_ORF00249 [Vairimorpha apis BRL 01]|uniref:Uncharacterized protein n=1 Tax=Vairimorpha apis BRL 01 TaxID=1037528 RepID=T0LCY7_9MICR|nr:hypothetical protein NAPIS_ORF00249 [Vairimorpha apis BRL 01]
MFIPFLIYSARCLQPLIPQNFDNGCGPNKHMPIPKPRYYDLLHCHERRKVDEFPVIFGQIPTFKRLVNITEFSSHGDYYNFYNRNELEDIVFIQVCFHEFTRKGGNIDCLILRHFLRIFFHKVLETEQDYCLDNKYIDNPDKVIEDILKHRGFRTLFKHWIECYLEFLRKFACERRGRNRALCISSYYAKLQILILEKLLCECNKHRFVGFSGKEMKHKFFFTVPSAYMVNPLSDKATLVVPIDSFVNVDLIEK